MLRTIPAQADVDKREPFAVLVADRSRMASRLLADMLGRKPQFNVVAAVVPAEVLAAVSDLRPEIVVLSADVDRNPARGIEIARALHANSPAVRTIILTDSCDRDSVVAAFRAGARGIFCRSEHLADFCKCVECVHDGQVWADHRQVQFLIDALIATAPSRILDARGNELLSGRELEVVQLAVKGCTNREIADKMKLSEHTVKNYMFRTFDKLGVSNRVEMLFYVLQQSGMGRRLASTSSQREGAGAFGELREEAEGGSISAQFALGTKYRHGNGVERNPADAYFWLRLAEERAKDIYEKSRAQSQKLASHATPAETELIEARVLEWLTIHGKKSVSRADASKRRPAV